ncbi:cilia- and flagella-associated protein 91-like isoform X2 [Drosophila bipectinata]
MAKKNTTMSTHEVKMETLEIEPKAKPIRSSNQQTQTLYRESSAQTLPYLPEVLDKLDVQELELFSLPTVLPGDTPPGLFEVEVLERSKKRWAFKNSLNQNIKTFFRDVRKKTIELQYQPILEALEWEQWIQREEYIQECQMMRLEIVIKMFNKREKKMHSASMSRIEKACEEIERRRQASLGKNERQFNRELRKLNAKKTKWRKESPLQALGSPCSEFYAPLLRHGVDPARRSYLPKTKRKAFDMRIDELEKKVNLKNVKCPFATLSKWSKPKEPLQEYEQNFCNDKNLQNLYESLKKLRTAEPQQKAEPRCLVKRPKADPKVRTVGSIFNLTRFTGLYEDDDSFPIHRKTKVPLNPRSQGFHSQSKQEMEKLRKETVRHQFEDILNSFEGTYIGYIMQFLSDELSRLKEQQKLHFYCMMAQKERWRREAMESGLRQKENHMRLVYEELFQHCTWAQGNVSDNYVEHLLKTDVDHCAQQEATEVIIDVAKQIDADIEKWLESFKEIQNPLTYGPLRKNCMDMILPDPEALLREKEITQIVEFVVEDVLFPRIWEELGPFDIGTTLTSDLIDRLIDNDLYLFSTDSEDDIPQQESWCESRAIIRKLIRSAVPEQHWKGEVERIVFENCRDLFDDVIDKIISNMENPGPPTLVDLHVTKSQSFITPADDIRLKEGIFAQTLDTAVSLPDTDFIRMHILNLIQKIKWDTVTRKLENQDNYAGDELSFIFDTYLKSQVINPVEARQSENVLNDIFSVLSSMDIPDEISLNLLKGSKIKVEKENYKEAYEESEYLSSGTIESGTDFSARQSDEDSLTGETKHSQGTQSLKHSKSTRSFIRTPYSDDLQKVHVSLDSNSKSYYEEWRGSDSDPTSKTAGVSTSASEIQIPNTTSTRTRRDDQI